MPDFLLASETWSRKNFTIQELLNPTPYKAVGFTRQRSDKIQPGGGCAIIYNEEHFLVSTSDINVPIGVEAVWRIASPKNPNAKVGKIAIGSFYISPKSKFKQESIEHIVEVIHCLRSKHEKISFLVCGDFNKVPVHEVLMSYGAMKQICSVATRKNASLEVILTHWSPFPPPYLPSPTSSRQ